MWSSGPSKQPGDLCEASKDCALEGSTCVGGFCTALCSDLGNVASIDCKRPSAYGPACLDYYPDAGPGQHVCCPTSGCPWNCKNQENGLRTCKSDGDCCGSGACVGTADAGAGTCWTLCDSNSDCDTKCCKPEVPEIGARPGDFAKVCQPKSACGGGTSTDGGSSSSTCHANTFYCDTGNGANGSYVCGGGGDSTMSCKGGSWACYPTLVNADFCKLCDPSCEINIDSKCNPFNCSN